MTTKRVGSGSAGSPRRAVKGVAYDTPIPGYDGPVVDLLRLWKSEAVESFDFQAFNVGDYYGAVEEKIASETITKVLYPNDEPASGKRLRLIAAVLLRLLFAPGHDPDPRAPGKSPGRPSRRDLPSSSTTPTPPSPSPN